MLDSTQKFCCSSALLSTPACQGCLPGTLNNSDGDKHESSFLGLQQCLILILPLKVFIHDPLYTWALTPLGAQQRQKDFLIGGDDSNPGEGAGGPQPTPAGMAPDAVGSTDTTIANADAERALLRLKQKLAGLEGGEPLVYLTVCA